MPGCRRRQMEVKRIVDAESLLQGLSKVEALPIGNRVQCPNLAGRGLAAVGLGAAIAVLRRVAVRRGIV